MDEYCQKAKVGSQSSDWNALPLLTVTKLPIVAANANSHKVTYSFFFFYLSRAALFPIKSLLCKTIAINEC